MKFDIYFSRRTAVAKKSSHRPKSIVKSSIVPILLATDLRGYKSMKSDVLLATDYCG